jgi:hypothetical protein
VLAIVPSKNGVSIRLTDERWTHITEEHGELAGLRLEVLEAVAQPARILEGREGALLAVRGVGSGQVSRCGLPRVGSGWIRDHRIRDTEDRFAE